MSCEGGFPKGYVGAAPRNRSNTVGPVVASLLRHEEKGRERGKKRKVLHRKIWQRFSSRPVGGEGRRGMTWGFKGFGRAAAPIFKSGRAAARVHGHARAGTSSCRSLESGGRVDWCKDAEGRTGQGPDAHDWSEVRAAGRWDLNLGARGGWGGKGLARYLGTWPCRGGVRSGPLGRGGGEGRVRECGQQAERSHHPRSTAVRPGGCRFRPGCASRFCFLREGACGY